VPAESPGVPTSVTVIIDGKPEQVSIEEAINGYQRQADYTRKTQALAQERQELSAAQQLWDAIEANPEQTLSQVAEAYGLKLTKAQAAAVAAGDNPFESEGQGSAPDNADPRWKQVEQFMAETQRTTAEAKVQSELAAVHAKYGVKFDDQKLLQFAVDEGIGSLDAAFKAMSFDAATQVAQGRRAKQTAPPVADGRPVAANSVTPGPGTKLMSISEAFAAAEAEING
jgi:hypothetical protein